MNNTHNPKPYFIDDEDELDEIPQERDLLDDDDFFPVDPEKVPFSYEDDTIPASERGFNL